jgi:hypothetical protein
MMQVLNLKVWGREGLDAFCGVYVGRPSVLGNPYRIGVHGSRAEVIEKYRRWLYERLVSGDRAVIEAIEALQEDSVLGCWCHPEQCHANVIIAAWHWWMSEGRSIYGR